MTQEEYNKAMKQRASGGYANTSINKVPYATSTDLINIDRRVVQSRNDMGMNYKEFGEVLDPLVSDAQRRTDAASRQYLLDKANKKQEAKLRRAAAKAEVDKMPSLDLSKIPPQFQPMLTEMLMQDKMTFANNAKIIAEGDPYSEEYMNAKTGNSSIIANANKYNNYFTNMQEENVGYLKDFDSGMISESNSDKDLHIIDQIRRNKAQITMDENKNIVYNVDYNGEILSIPQDQVPDYRLEDAEGATAYLDMYQKYIDNGNRYGIPYDDASVRLKLMNMFKGNRDRLLSMAYDDVGSTGLSFDEWYDNEIAEGRKQPVDWRAPQNEDLLRKELTDYYANVISNGVGTAVGNYNARKKPKGDDDPVATVPAWNDWMQEQLDSGVPASTQEYTNNVFAGTDIEIAEYDGNVYFIDKKVHKTYANAANPGLKTEALALMIAGNTYLPMLSGPNPPEGMEADARLNPENWNMILQSFLKMKRIK